MDEGGPPRSLLCPACGNALEPMRNGSPAGDDAGRVVCRRCGKVYQARRRGRSGSVPSAAPDESSFIPRPLSNGPPALPARPPDPPAVGHLGLTLRGWGLQWVEWWYRAGTFSGTLALLAAGGFVPVTAGWLRDEINGWGHVVEALGGVWVETEAIDPDADLGPAIVYGDAPALFSAVGDVARRLGARPPQQVRLSYLPCCGVVAWRRSSALVLGLPLLHVLTMAELRAVLAHELAHLARGDATSAARSARFVHALGQALDRAPEPSRSPLRFWARVCRKRADALLSPIARGQEWRADRSAATVAGGDAAASALVKVALVQPLFREVLDHYDPTAPDTPNLYAFFREFWSRLPETLHTAMRLQLLSGQHAAYDGVHPPLPDRLTVVQAYPTREVSDHTPARRALGDLEALEQMLHNRLFSTPGIEPSVFHRAGT